MNRLVDGAHAPRQSRTAVAAVVAVVVALLAPLAGATPVQAASAVGQGFSITPSDLSFILAQIKIAERHAATLTPANPCLSQVGTGPDQIPSPLVSKGLRTVDGSCNNLQPGQGTFGSADQVFPRISTPVFRDAEAGDPDGPGPAPTADSSYKQKKGIVFDSQPRVISNLIVDQTSTNPAAIAAAGFPVRSQGGDPVTPCTTDPDPLATPPVEGVPAGCTPSHQTLFIPNVTTDVGLSPPYNSLFTLFGQFFDHGVDQTVKSGGTVFVPLKNDDPLIAGPDHVLGNADDLPPSLRFMVLTRAQNQPGADGILGDDPTTTGVDESADDVQDATNTDSPWVDQSQTYTSHSSHQVFLREYVAVDGRPVATGKLLGGQAAGLDYPGAADGREGISTWGSTKKQAHDLLGIKLTDVDALNIPMLAADPYGEFIPGANGLPQFVTKSGLKPARLDDPATPDVDETAPVPADVLHFDTPFLTDIAHNADPSMIDTNRDGRPDTFPVPDTDTVASADFASQPRGTYDDEMLSAHFACGDGRCNENIGLTTIHQIFHSEHDRLIDDMTSTLNANPDLLADYRAPHPFGADNADISFGFGNRLFQAARFVTEMEYQHLVFEEFARKVQPAINPFEPFAFTQTEINPAVKAEFAHAVYRFGHSMLTDTISRKNADGSPNDISLLQGFLNPPAYYRGGTAGTLTARQAAGSVVMGMSDQAGNELDEFVTETLRNNLLGLPLDLPTINMTRARSEGIPPLNVFRRQVFNKTNDGQMTPYKSWVDFGEHLKHPESLVNFVAAYGQHPTITSQTTIAGKREAARLIVNPTAEEIAAAAPPADAAAFMNSTGATWSNDGTASRTGLDTVDLWVGGLAEVTNVFGGLLGSTFNYVFENQLTDLQNGDRLYYLARTPGMNLRTQLEGNSFAEMIMRNTDAHSLKADAFATADCKFELSNLAGTQAGFDQFGNMVADDPASECDESAVLIRLADGTIKYRSRNTVDPSGINGQSVYNGTDGVDRMYGGNDSDTFWGGLSRDWIEGGDGADVALGGEGDDIITDLNGDDVSKGGPGDDAIDAGPGLDIVMGGTGKDFTNGGANANETFGGDGDDFIMLGDSLDAAFGDSGDDYEEGGNQPDLMQGDSGNLFFLDDSQKPGSDILVGQGGDDDYDMEGGDDIGLGGPGIEKVAGASGYDWEIGIGDPQPQDMDLAISLLHLDILQVGVRDKFNEVEALSGGDLDDVLRGDDLVPSAVGGGGFIGCDALDQRGLDRIDGLDALVPPLATPLRTVIATSGARACPFLTDGLTPAQIDAALVWGDGNILLGGGGNDLIEGRAGDDIIDGDRYLNVRLSVRDDAGVEIGSATANQVGQSPMTSQYLRDSAGALTGPTLQEAVFAGVVDPGNIVAVREIRSGAAGTDTAVFSGNLADSTITQNAGTITVSGADGVDTLRGIEQLRFDDQTVDFGTAAVPGAPTIGTATAGNGSATVTWDAPASTGGSPITSYRVQVLSGGTVIDTILGIAPTARSQVVTGLTNGQTYTFRVLAVNVIGASAPSAQSNAVTPATVPGAPSIGTATAGNASATVTWSAPAATGGSPVTSYQVEVLTGGGVVSTVTGIAATARSQVVTGLTNGQTYTFRVVAVNAIGASAPSAQSNAVTPLAPPTAPGAPAIGTATAGTGSATVTWAAPGSNGGSAITSYEVLVRTGGAVVRTVTGLAPTATSTVVTGLTERTTYDFQVRAVNAVGTGPASAVSNAVTIPDRTDPTITRRFPAPGATGIRRAVTVTADFSERVVGVRGATFVLSRTSNGVVVDAVVTLSADGRTATLDPRARLAAGANYTVTIVGGATAVRDPAGNTLATSTWRFTTR